MTTVTKRQLTPTPAADHWASTAQPALLRRAWAGAGPAEAPPRGGCARGPGGLAGGAAGETPVPVRSLGLGSRLWDLGQVCFPQMSYASPRRVGRHALAAPESSENKS